MVYVAICAPLLLALPVIVFAPKKVDSSETPFAGPADGTKPHPAPGRLSLVFLALSFACAPAIALVQWAAFRLSDSFGPRPLFLVRATDSFIYALLPGLFVGFCYGALLLYHLARWWYGAHFREFLFTTDRDGPMHRQFNLIPAVTLIVAAGLTVLNLLARDTFVELRPGEVAFSQFWSFGTTVRTADEIESIRLFRRHRAPIGNVTERRHIVFRFRDGERYNSFFAVEPESYPEFQTKTREAFEGRVPVVFDDGVSE